MSNRQYFWAVIPTEKMPVPIFISTVLAISIFLDQFTVLAGVLIAGLPILLIVRWANQREKPLEEIAEIVLRNEEQNAAHMEAILRKNGEANETTIRTWRQYAYAVWILLAALLIRVGYIVFVECFPPSNH